MTPYDEDLSRPRTELLHLLKTEESWPETLERIARIACATIPGCSAGSVTLWREGQPYTVASSDELAQSIDDAQYDVMEGPCLDASRYGHTYVVDDMRDEPRWPTFSGVAAQRGALSSMSVPLVPRDEPIGALNLYSTRPLGFEGAERAGRAFASQAAVAISNARLYQASRALVEGLERALRESAEVEQAKGRLMAELGIPAEEAARRLSENAPDGGPQPPTLEE